jgi:hypothetical protein
MCCCAAGGGYAGASRSSPEGVAPRAAVAAPVKTSPGNLWLAAQALPCHAIQMSTWEMVSVISSPYSSSSPATITGHLVKISELSSQALFCDAVS